MEYDSSKIDDNKTIHVAFEAIYEFMRRNNHQLPKPWCNSDAQILVSICKEIKSKLLFDFRLNENLTKIFSFVSTGS